ncbi:MAG: gamma-glutamyltransferase family protein [Desulfurococcales archaeon]|nr:gamma-glutamyltransferase family protein [Desulfurococcales archaeon]
MLLGPRTAYTRSYGVACENPLACEVGFSVLREGGNAADASVALSLALSVVVPHLGGIGGDFFALIHEGVGKPSVLNASGWSPRGLTREALTSRGLTSMPARGPLSITVPGMLAGLYELWRRYGSLEWRKLVEPAAKLARGFPAHRALVASFTYSRELLESDPGSREEILSRAPEHPWQLFSLPSLARVLEEVAEDPRVFYEGWIAERIVSYVRERGGLLDKSDLSEYSPLWMEPLSIERSGWILYEMPPNTQGATTLHIVSALPEAGLRTAGPPLFRHIMDAAPPAYEYRDRFLGDPESVSELLGSLNNVVSRETLELIALRAAEYSGRPCHYPGNTLPAPQRSDTTFFVVRDSEGMTIAGIQSLFNHWGSGLTVPGLGVTLNNRASGFTLEPGLPNTVGPRKRPLHTLSAVSAVRGEELVVLGTSGGHYRPQQHAMMLVPILYSGAGAGEAIAMPRLLWRPGTCEAVADGPGSHVAEALGLSVRQGRTGVAAALRVWPGGVVEISSDPRGDGFPQVAP